MRKQRINRIDNKSKKGKVVTLIILLVIFLISGAIVFFLNIVNEKEVKVKEKQEVKTSVPAIEDVKDIDTGSLITDTALKPDENKIMEYDIDNPKKVKIKDKK